MAKDYSKFSKEELIKYIEELQVQLKSTKYGLYWDKSIEQEEKLQNIIHNIPILKRCENLNCGDINNILIEGDNIESLMSLNMIGNDGFVDIIYIDPPYNTGHKSSDGGFKYNDEFINEDNGYKHSKWLSFMEKRLILAKKMLSNSGSIFISIDDNECATLKLLCDKLFGKRKFVTMIPRITKAQRAGQERYMDISHDYILCYSNRGDFEKIMYA